MSNQVNITRIKAVFHALEELAPEVIFVGGAVVSLYADRPYSETRATDDIDILVELFHYAGYAALEDKLRNKGFINDAASGVICRYTIHGVIVDVMPVSENVLGFSNKWYLNAMQYIQPVQIDESCKINILSPVHFLAAKLEAYKNRGGNDGRSSTDFEDIIFILNNRSAVWNEMEDANETVKAYLRYEFQQLLEEKYIDEWISCNLNFAEQSRAVFIANELKKITRRQDF
jgi:predicted nucleotidyltransferase